MAKTGDTPDRKPKARSRASRPSFAPAAAPLASSAWVYRSDVEAAKPAPAARAVTAAVPTKSAAKPVAKPAAKAAARRAPARVPTAATDPGGLTQVLDLVTLPLTVSLMAVLAPMRWLLGPRH